MRKIFVVLMLVLTGVAQAQTGAPLTETLQWMHDFVVAQGHTSSSSNPTPGLKSGDPFRIDDFTFDSKGCSVVTTWRVRIGVGDDTTTTESFSLKSLDPASTVIEDDGMYWGVWVYTFNNRELIKSRTKGKNAQGQEIDFGGDGDMTQVGFLSQSDAKRFAKALKHAITLCGGKTSAF